MLLNKYVAKKNLVKKREQNLEKNSGPNPQKTRKPPTQVELIWRKSVQKKRPGYTYSVKRMGFFRFAK